MVPIPPALKDKVFLLPDVDRAEGLSSTKLRKSLSKGEPVGDALEAETVKYIKQRKLFGAPFADSSANNTAGDAHGD